MLNNHRLLRTATRGLLGITALGLVSYASAATAPVFQNSSQIACHDGNVRLSKIVKNLFQDDFRKADSTKWEPFKNFEGLLVPAYGDFQGIVGFSLTKDKKQKATDTAYEMISKPFTVQPGSTFVFTIAARGTVDMYRATGHKDSYHNHIVWFDKAGKELPEPFKYRYRVKHSSTADNTITGKVPAAAASAVIHIGADAPNITPDTFICYTNVTFSSEADDAPLYTTGDFISAPIANPGTSAVTVDADLPAGTSVTALVSTADDADGIPAAWSDFRAPVAGARPAWLRYKLVLNGNGKDTPTVKAVRVGSHTDTAWSGNDTAAPDITRITPFSCDNPAAPVQFRLTDASCVDWSTLSVKLDGDDITSQLVRNGNVITYTPATPFAPPSSNFNSLNGWTLTSNFKNALTIISLDDIPSSRRFTREDAQVDSAFNLASPILLIREGQNYTFSFDERSNLTFEKSTPKNAPVKIEWLDAKGTRIGEPVRDYFDNNNTAWKRYSFTHQAPAGAAKVRVNIGFDTPNIFDEAYFDIAKPAIDGPDIVVPPNPNPNFHSFSITAADIAGNKTTVNTFCLIDKQQARVPKATIRQDGAILIAGKPFFPIGVYAVCKREFNNNDFKKAFADLKAAGFNTAHTYGSTRGPDFTEFLNTAQDYGFKLYIASGAGANCMSIPRIIHDVIRERNHPAILSWYLADDTASHVSDADLKALSDAVHEADDCHLTSQADPVGDPTSSRYRDYVHSTDIFLPEIYPIRQGVTGAQGVPQVIRDMKTIQVDLAANGNPAKSIWPIIQYFDGWTSWDRFPTADELRAMSFLSIIHGGMGITWYTYGGFNKNHGVTNTPETWANISRVATELNALQDVFLSEQRPADAFQLTLTDGPQKDALGYPSISVLAKQYDGKLYLICANSANAAVTTSFAVKASSGLVRFENRSLTIQNGAFTDTFKPFDVHVYELK